MRPRRPARPGAARGPAHPHRAEPDLPGAAARRRRARRDPRHPGGAARPAHLLAAADVDDSLPETADALLAIDDVDQLAPDAQIALFNAFNRARSNGQSLLLSGPAAPLALRLREDLRTRIGQSLIYEVQPLDDASRAAILATLAERRGLRLADEVVDFLLRHGRRELSSLREVLDALDRASLEHKRPITLPLLRDMIQQGLEI